MKITRREFIAGGLIASGLSGFAAWTDLFADKAIPGELLGASAVSGHKLRAANLPAPARTLRSDVVIVGGGIAGLTAGYTLHKAGIKDFMLLELEAQHGGNSCSGINSVSAYPWGAHYVPLLTRESTVARKLFEDFGVIKGYAKNGLPIYDEYFLCADPHERLFMHGRWQDGLVPETGITDEVEAEYKKFFALMEKFKQMKGLDGKTAFAIPLDESSQDARLLALDNISMHEWLKIQGLVSSELHWYINYCCRDDFGTESHATSAWAGIHYFASRSGQAANAAVADVITWPEGNGWLVNKLASPIKDKLYSEKLVYRVIEQDKGAIVEYLDLRSGEAFRIETKSVIMSAPRFVAARLLNNTSYATDTTGLSYAPWAVANVTLRKLPEGRGVPLSWDNVAYNGTMLGYVNATHQIPQMNPLQTVLTCYWPLSHLEPDAARRQALDRSYADWQKLFLDNLLQLHPELAGQIERLDVWVWGHAMVRPTPGFIWGQHRRKMQKQRPPIFMAHSDMSGISIFEEACTRGAHAAQAVLSRG